MSPLETPPDRYVIVELAGDDGALKTMRIRADTACEPKVPTDKWMVFKKDGDVVGKVHVHNLAGWHVEEAGP